MSEQEVVRRILTEIERNPAISQRRLAGEIGISVGMINWHIKRCISKGLIKLQQAPLRRYLYYLTPAGFVEKAELTARFLQGSFNIFRIGREGYHDLFARCVASNWNNVVLIGRTELTELALMVAPHFGEVEIVGIIDRNHKEATGGDRQPRGAPIVADSGSSLLRRTGARQIDALLTCHFMIADSELKDHGKIVDELGVDRARLLTPEFLL
jgi:DNA-binding MarR family transcriptional regulator